SLSGVLEPARGDAVTPVAVADCPEDAPLVAGDHFGPALAVVPVDSVEHALAVHERSGPHLATSVFTRDRREARAIAAQCGSRTVTINDCLIPTGHPGASIGGRLLSGWGASRGVAGLLAMSAPTHLARTARVRPPTAEPTPGRAAAFDRAMSV